MAHDQHGRAARAWDGKTKNLRLKRDEGNLRGTTLVARRKADRSRARSHALPLITEGDPADDTCPRAFPWLLRGEMRSVRSRCLAPTGSSLADDCGTLFPVIAFLMRVSYHKGGRMSRGKAKIFSQVENYTCKGDKTVVYYSPFRIT